MPFTLAHPAAVLPLLRHPFVPVALIAGSMAPDVPYFLTAVGIRSTHAGDWYGSFLNATSTHSLTGLPIDLLYAVLLVGAYWLLQAPISALGLTLPKIGRPNIVWLLISALIGAATHLLWDYLTEADFMPAPRLLQYASTVFGLVVVGWYLWKHRDQFRAGDDTTPRLSATTRRVVIGLLIAAPLLAAAVLAPADYSDYQSASESWTGVAEGVLTGAIKRAGAAFVIALLFYAAASWTTRLTRRSS
ncbi:DUF4184 family protein [Kribbella antibiotica]|uniref:DUF4184 family protein n=1 Tax=Kribbella antibiotica TaxID=190195 RepID=A0A4R4ZNB2_9ACTN|nr:DUF4184 family protein [Kribbella antibiotica]TDD59616.1 DUF4184 family protein [Kribbella antibiotica]